jgi:phage terminase Nu1 subunit (DNA packaging protein)
MAIKPIPLMTREQIAHVLAIAAPSVTKLEAEGLPRTNPGDRRPLYDVRAVVQWWIARKTEQLANRAPDGLVERDQRARYYQQKANQLERENAQKGGHLVEPELLERALSKVVQEIAAALSALPSQLKVEIPHLRASEVTMIGNRIARMRNALARIELTQGRTWRSR